MFHAVDITGSTNDDARALALKGAVEGTTITARQQTAGRGRQGNQWVSESGNLFMSVILRPNCTPVLAGHLSFMAAVAMAEVLQTVLPESVPVQLKWPNDVMLDGKKLAGILLESDIGAGGKVETVILGIGVNLSSSPENGTHLQAEGVTDLTPEELAQRIHRVFMAIYRTWQNDGFDFAPIRATWLRYAFQIGRDIRVRLPQETFTAQFTGIDETGALALKMEDGTERRIASAEVFGL